MRGAKQTEMFEISDLRREILHLRSVRLFSPEGGVVLLYFHANVGLGYFGGSNVLNFNIFLFFFYFFFFFFFWGGGVQKTEYFWGYEDFVDTFWGHHKIGLSDAF